MLRTNKVCRSAISSLPSPLDSFTRPKTANMRREKPLERAVKLVDIQPCTGHISSVF